MSDAQGTHCGRCGRPIIGEGDDPKQRKPCPYCGSTTRTFFVHARVQMSPVASVAIATQHAAASALPAPPRIGEFLICLFVRPNRQVDRLADFAGLFRTVWLPRFGPRLAIVVYLANVLWSAADVVKISAIGAAVDFIYRLFRR
jgi:DNA-directed RNA polymerase subunit RPC12/RpoP